MGKHQVFDDLLFREAVADVKPLACDCVPVELPRPSPLPKQRLLDDAQVRQEMLSDDYDPANLETGEELLFMRSGIQYTTMRRLRRGYFSIGAELDLHGMVVPVARVAVAQFLHQCRERDIRCVRIVHGKGCGSWQKQPVLKIKLNKWLRQRDEVLAFCSARPMDGGVLAQFMFSLKSVKFRQILKIWRIFLGCNFDHPLTPP